MFIIGLVGSILVKNENLLQSHQAAARMLRLRRADRRAAVLPDPEHPAQEPFAAAHDLHHDALLPAGNVRKKRPASGSGGPARHGCPVPARQKAPLQNQ